MREAPRGPGAIFALCFPGSGDVAKSLKEPVDLSFGAVRYAAPRRRRASYGGFGKPDWSLTLLIWKEKRRRRCPGGNFGYLDTDELAVS